MFFYLKISCKDKKIFRKFISFLKKLNFLPISLKLFSKSKKRKFVTVLKSPHVNKTAQEQFEYRFYSKDFLIYSFKPLTFFLLLKKLKNKSFPGIKLKFQGIFRKSNLYKHTLRIMTPDNICFHQNETENRCLKKISTNAQCNFLSSKKYVQLFDLYGETCLKSFLYS